MLIQDSNEQCADICISAGISVSKMPPPLDSGLGNRPAGRQVLSTFLPETPSKLFLMCWQVVHYDRIINLESWATSVNVGGVTGFLKNLKEFNRICCTI